ncbi:hypothetical protein IQ243_27030 [Nostocales cyanobacterium LEGE 11386]|nr:hypothetical protein [Nostocales cyanobacterium LEGE 11386]
MRTTEGDRLSSWYKMLCCGRRSLEVSVKMATILILISWRKLAESGLLKIKLN